MKEIILCIMVLSGLFGFQGKSDDPDPSNWSNKKIDEWFNKREWSSGWSVAPDPSVDRRAFAISFFRHKERWEKAFLFLKNSNLSSLEPKRYDIDGDNLYATISEYITKDEDKADFEVHRLYIDIQYVISGTEIMNLAPLRSVKGIIKPYDSSRDIEFVRAGKVTNYIATPSIFFIFFPTDIHRPGLKNRVNSPVRKIVVKLRVD